MTAEHLMVIAAACSALAAVGTWVVVFYEYQQKKRQRKYDVIKRFTSSWRDPRELAWSLNEVYLEFHGSKYVTDKVLSRAWKELSASKEERTEGLRDAVFNLAEVLYVDVGKVKPSTRMKFPLDKEIKDKICEWLNKEAK